MSINVIIHSFHIYVCQLSITISLFSKILLKIMLIVSSEDTLVESIIYIKWHHCIIFWDFLFSNFLGNSLLPFTVYQDSLKGFNNCVKYFSINLDNRAMIQLLALNRKFKGHYERLKQNIPLCKVVSPLSKSWYTVQNN